MKNKKISVIGAGYSGLVSACYLAKAGYEVTVYEKNDTPKEYFFTFPFKNNFFFR